MRKILVEESIFEKFPDFKRGIVVAQGIKVKDANEELEEMLGEAAAQRSDPSLLQHSYILAWDEMHRRFGSNPNKYPPSIKALLKRTTKGKEIPFINTVVALFNYISLKYLLPCGGDDADRVEGNFKLGFASGKEIFIPLGGSQQENPQPGEVIYYDDATLRVMCRKWNWRNGDFSKITSETTAVVINVDGAERVSEDAVLQARDELAELMKRFCGGSVKTALLTRNSPVYSL